MAILRSNRTKGFAHIPYEAIRDRRLKLKDKGFLCYLLTLPDGWDFSIDGMVVAIGTDGKDAISSSVKRLEECGYLHRERTRDEHGHLRTSRWVVSDFPMTDSNPLENPPPTEDYPMQENPAQVNPSQRNININNHINIPSTKDKYKRKDINNTKGNNYQSNNDFAVFWDAYPKRVGKETARKAFQKLGKDVTLDTLLKAIEVQKNTQQWKKDNGQFIPHPSTWLNQKRWEDEVNTQIQPAARSNNPFLDMLKREEGQCEQETDFANVGHSEGCVPLSLQGHERR